MPCEYCGVPGCHTETCPERLETYYNLPEDGSVWDLDDEEEDE